MNTQFDLFPETLLVSCEGGRIYTDSLRVAEHFGKQHKDVLRTIKRVFADLAEAESHGAKLRREIDPSQLADQHESEFRQRNFAPAEFIDARGKPRLMYQLSHDGFALLSMGFTGKTALKWKVKFLAAFRDMERQLAAFREREANALYGLRPRWKPIMENPEWKRATLIKLTGHKSPGSITACRRRMRQVGLLLA